MRQKSKPIRRVNKRKIYASVRRKPPRRRINSKRTVLKGHYKHKSLNPKLRRMKRAVPKGGKNSLHDDFDKIGVSELRRPLKPIKGGRISKKTKKEQKAFNMKLTPQDMNMISLGRRLGLPVNFKNT